MHVQSVVLRLQPESFNNVPRLLFSQGLAKYVDWSASLLEDDVRRRLKNAELQAKKSRLRIWTNYVPPATNSKAIHDQNFTGKVSLALDLFNIKCFSFI